MQLDLLALLLSQLIVGAPEVLPLVPLNPRLCIEIASRFIPAGEIR